MKTKGLGVLAVGFAVSMLILNLSVATAQPPASKNFVAPLEGEQEVPPVDTNAKGLAKFQINKDGDLNFRLNVANIENVTQAHIHCGAEGVNGPVVVFLFGFVPGGVDVNGVLATGTITDADIVNDACGATLNELLEEMRDGNTYVNVHTTQNPPGEIRGQISEAGPSN